MKRLGLLTVAIGLVTVILALPAGADSDPWTVTVTIDECTATLTPSGRTVYYTDSEGRSGGPIHTPDTVTLGYPDGGWIVVELIHDPGADEGVSVTKRFDIPGPCNETTTTGGTSSTTQPEATTTTEDVSSTTVPSTTTTQPSSTTTRPTTTTSSMTPSTTTTTVPRTTTTVRETTTSSSTTSTVPTTSPPDSSTTTVRDTATTTTVPEATPTTEPVTDTTIVSTTLPDCPPDTVPTGDGCELPNTGMSAAQVFTIAAVALITGVAILGASTVFGVWKEAKR